ncbi:uncharacterized protein Z518_04909 [Rhinocladiella mackenziei CBS 650.93]|uniref:Methyltransferase type 11 domain-containing protein n=1 Tax=Rhinocladiella mackenziei CBS 650.93 TaxID=1442369 RepID=A0A0D2H8Y1_9EURO|nr:uncharacterized protein Z518_04909 [Rhinocladiella mackenziei CBS 650.93]KIX06933.1 hypothetical protein Z518_04909 [Rhinocladiella mackenziei CBS 650.93]
MKTSELPEAVKTGFAPAAAYDAHRPSYPEEAVEQLLQGLKVAGVKGANFADLAAGTGKFTELLARRPEEYDIIAIGTHDGMRAQLAQKNLARVRIMKGTADNLVGIPDGSLAGVVAAQVSDFSVRFATMDALKEIARVLKPTGGFGGIWNIDDCALDLDSHRPGPQAHQEPTDNSPRSWKIYPGWESVMRDVVWTLDDNMPRFRHEKWRQVFDDRTESDPLSPQFADSLFKLPLGESEVEFEAWLSKDAVWSRLRTPSQLAILEGEEREKVRKTFWDSVDSESTKTDEFRAGCRAWPNCVLLDK